MTRTLVPICMLLIPLTCAAQAHTSDAEMCRNGLFPRQQEGLRLGAVQGQKHEKVHLFDDFDGCPSKGAECKRAKYLVPGNAVLVGKSTADWTCVWYQGRKHEIVSWVSKKNVAVRSPVPFHPVRDWVGTWSDRVAKIHISPVKNSDHLHISSKLRWEGGNSPEGEPRANYGGIEAALTVQGSKATGAEGACQVVLTRVGKYLVADDNGACGGMNVRHTGVYLRRPNYR